MSTADDLLVWCTDGDDIQVKNSLKNCKKVDRKVKQAALFAAVINGHHKVVEVLLSFSVNVNCKSQDQSDYTPLHFAASKGHLNCAKVLLKYHADIAAKDASGNTPTELAKRNAKTAVARLLMSEEIVQAVGMLTSTRKENDLYSLLDIPLSQLDSDCFDRALLTAVSIDNANVIGELVVRGATNIQDALAKSKKERKLQSMAMLLLLTAVTTNDDFLLAQLTGNPTPTHNLLANVPVDDIRQAIANDTEFLNKPIEIAEMHQNEKALHVLLMHSRVYKEGGKVDWHGHNLSQIDESLFHELPWVRHLILSSTKLSEISDTFHSNLMLCTTLELQGNNIQHVPNGIFELPFIKEIDISHNRVVEIYDDCRWSDSLESVNLSHNMLTNLSVSIVAPYLKSLDISHNRFDYIPSCLKGFKLLRALNVSYNVGITKIPITLGFLKYLTKLELEGLTNVADPPQDVLNDFPSCMQYLKDKLYSNTPFYHLRLMLLGQPGVGKTTLARLLVDGNTSKSTQDEDVVLSEWNFAPSSDMPTHHYTIWDVPGKEEYGDATNLFLRKRTLYLLLWNITEGPKGVNGLHKTMYNLSIHAPGCCVIIVATFLDCISSRDRQAGKIQELLQHAASFSKQFPLIGVSHITAISLQSKRENLSKLKQYIYHSAHQFSIDNVPVMGEMLSENHHIIYQHIRHLQKQASDGSRTGYMNKKEFIDVQISSLRKLHFLYSADVFDLLSFFHSAGFLFQAKGLYVFHPSWLFKTVSSLAAKQNKELINHGVVRRSRLLYILGCEHQVENGVLNILQKSCIALPLDAERSYFFLQGSLLPEKSNDTVIDISFIRYLTFKSPISGGFWNQLFVYLIFTVAEIQGFLSSLVPMKGPTSPTSTDSLPPTGSFKIWREGISCKAPDLQFHVELLKPSRGCNGLERIMVCASPGKQSVQVFCRILDAIFELIQLNFPESDKKILQQVTCMPCLKAGVGNSAQLTLNEQLWSTIRKGKSNIVCCLRVHELPLVSLLPDCFLMDFDSTLMYGSGDISCDKTTKVAFNVNCCVYKGTVNGKSASVLYYNVEHLPNKLRMLRHNVRFLDSLSHPCIASFLGCSLLPEISLSFEATPLEQNLDEILSCENVSISRILLYRIAVQISSALHYLHEKGIALGCLSASNILMMSLDLDVLINCKIFYFSSAGYVDYSSTAYNGQPLIPDVISPSSKTIVDFRVDMFLYSIFLYRLITRHAPFHNLAEGKVMDVILNGGRPSFESDVRANAGLCQLTYVMKECWKSDPDERPTAFTVTQQLSTVSQQLLMGVHYINSELSLRNVCSVVDDCQALKELWLCYDANEGLDLIICNAQTLKREDSHSLPNKQVCSIYQHGDTMCVASRLGLEAGTVDLYSIESRKHEKTISLSEQSVMSMTSTESDVYFGTYEGFCYKLTADDWIIPTDSSDYLSQALSEHSIQGLVVVNSSLWAASSNTIYILELDTLAIVDKLQRGTKNKVMPVGQLKPTHDEKKMVSVVFGGSHISLWDIIQISHICDINVMEFTRVLKLDSITLISAMTPALDTIWVGMESGLIMVFSLENPRLLTYFQPYNSYIRFLYCVKGPGVCGSEEYIILCGGKHYHQETDGSNKQQTRKKETTDPGTVTVWEVVSASRLTQMCQLSSGDTWTNLDTLNSAKSPNPLLNEEKYATLIDEATATHVDEDSKETQPQ